MTSLPSRRRFLQQAGGGMGSLALLSQLLKPGEASSPTLAEGHEDWFSPQRAKVKRIIWLFMHGGPSHMDLFDPKPLLKKLDGKTIPDSFGPVRTRRAVARNPLLGPLKPFRPRGESGIEVSDFLPQIAKHVDDLCIVRSMHGDSVNHPQSVYQMNTGSILMGRPSVGSWVAFGLGSENQDLPSFVVLPDPRGGLKGGPPAWGSGFLPATFQGVTMRSGKQPILHLRPPAGISPDQHRESLTLTQRLNAMHLASRGGNDELEARIAAYELAFRMQSAAPELVDIDQETMATRQLYGLEGKATQEFGTRCLLARRLLERGVRFVQVYSGDTNGWDAHKNVLTNHTEYCRATDGPISGLLTDLKQRGLWDDTLVIWGGEFGRMPMSEQGTGRDHNPWGYCCWLGGGGVRAGHVHGATDDIGLRAEVDKVHVSNLHATILHLLGIDPKALSYFHNGLDERLIGPTDDVDIVPELLA